MSQCLETTDIEKAMEEIDDAIITHNKIVEKLKLQRYTLFSKKLDLEMDDVLECVVENDISPRRMMDLIIAEVEERSRIS